MERLVEELVVDTSVFVKFFTREPDSLQADALLEGFRQGAVRFVAVDFLFVEFANVLWHKTSRGELTEAEAEEKIQDLLTWHMEIVPVRSVLLATFRTACRHAHAAYDAAFLALAESRGIRFITADEKFYEKARRHSPAPVLLSDLAG